MTEKKTLRHGHDDQIGKVFLVVGNGVRKCMVCEQLFTQRAACQHAAVDCYPYLSPARTNA